MKTWFMQHVAAHVWVKGHYLDCWIRAWRSRWHTRAWIRRWPTYCRACGGWGGENVYNYPHEPDWFEPCDALPMHACHRCGYDWGLDGEGGGPCINCGWNFDDGLHPDPHADDCACWHRYDYRTR